MAQYYYTVASLPMLSYEHEPPIDTQYFLDSCINTVNAEDYRILCSADLVPNDAAEDSILILWTSWEKTLRNELVKMRSASTGLDAESYIRENNYSTGAYDAAREAYNSANPLLGEDVLNKARWAFLDNLEVGHYFDLSRLIIYYLKLQLLQRRQLLKPEVGKKKYSELYNQITDKIHQSYDGEL